METKIEILKKFMYNSKLRYNEIWDKSVPSSQCNYYLKELKESEFIEKDEEGFYSLTPQGFEFLSNLDGQDFKRKKKPLICAFVLVIDSKENKILLQKRLKQPYLGIWGAPGGKIEFLEEIEDTAKRETFEETGLEITDLSLKIIDETHTYLQKKPLQHILCYYYITTHFQGELTSKNREGENKWFNISEIKDLPMFAEVKEIIPLLIDHNSYQLILSQTTVNNNDLETNDVESCTFKKIHTF